jgi:hypothetical protein
LRRHLRLDMSGKAHQAWNLWRLAHMLRRAGARFRFLVIQLAEMLCRWNMPLTNI